MPQWLSRTAPLLTALACALVIVGPALGTDDIIGFGYNDLHGTLWFRWQLLDALQSGRSVADTPLVAAPIGTDLLSRNGLNLLDAALALPLVALLGNFDGHDAWSVVLVMSNALAFYRLSGELVEHVGARCFGAVVFALSPIFVSELGGGRPTQAFLPFLCLGLRQALRLDKDPWAWTWCGLHLALTGLTYWYAAIWGGLLLGLAGLSRHPRRALMAMGLALVLVAPWLMAYADRVSAGTAPLAITNTTTPHPMIVLWWTGALALMDPDQGIRVLPLAMFPSAGPELLLGLFGTAGLALRSRTWRALGLASFLCLALALGPSVFGLGPNPVHGLWMTLGPLARRLWFPCRALVVPAMVGALSLSLLLDRALQTRRSRLAGGAAALALPLWLASLFTLEILPVRTWNPPSPPPVTWLADQGEGAVIVLPSTKESTWLVHQIQHGKPVQLQLGGQNPLLAVPEATAWLAEHPVLDLLELVVKGHVPPRKVTEAERLALVEDGFRWLLVDFGAIDSTRSPKAIQTSRRRLTRLLGEPVSAGDNMVIWALDPAETTSDPRTDPEPGSSAPRTAP